MFRRIVVAVFRVFVKKSRRGVSIPEQPVRKEVRWILGQKIVISEYKTLEG